MPIPQLLTMSPVGCLALLASAASPAAAAAPRTSYAFDFGWKFHLGNVAQNDDALCPSSEFTQNLDGYYCEGWGHQAAYQLQLDECRLYCCGDPNCAGYSFKGNFCVIGSDVSACKSGAGPGWTGEARSVPAVIAQPAAQGPQETDFDDSKWVALDVPHDYVVATDPSSSAEKNHGYRPKNISWYRKSFKVPAEVHGQHLFLEFDGVFRSSDMWLNGHYLGHHSSGYTSFRWRIDNATGFNLTGQNVLAVRTDPRANEGWWYEGGGIYRHTRFLAIAPLHVAQWGVYIPSQVVGPITTANTSSSGGGGTMQADSIVQVYTEVESDEAAPYYVVSTLRGTGGEVLWEAKSATQRSSAGTTVTIFQQTPVLAALPLWDVYAPQLLTMITQVYKASSASQSSPDAGLGSGGTVLADYVETKFGVRKVHLDVDYGLFLNDRSIKVKGMCNHQDFAGIGVAVPDSINDFRVARLKELGANAWRMSHNPPNPELLDATDRLGFMVWDENRFFGDFPTWYTDMADMIKRDRNHPSIIWWSLCNEFGCTQLSDDVTLKIGVKFKEIIKSLDPSRPISGAWNFFGTPLTPVAGEWGEQVCDMMGINYDYGALEKYHEMHPTTPLISSESCSCTSDRTYEINDTRTLIGAYHAWNCIEACWVPMANQSFVQGSFDWTGFDYRGEETPSSWPAINSHFGILDLAGYMKDDAYYYKAWYNTDVPLAHITPQNWNYETSTSPNGTIGVMTCTHSDIQQWIFDTAAASAANGTGSTLESKHKRGQCLVFNGYSAYPSFTDACSATNPAMRFHYDKSSKHIFHITTDNKRYCMDVNGNNDGSVGFFACKNGDPSKAFPFYDNQAFSYQQPSGVLTQSRHEAANVCLTYVDGASVQVWVYTNGDEVELLLNGKSLGSMAIAPWDKGAYGGGLVVFEPGNLTAVVKKAGKAWASDTTITTTAASSLQLTVDPLMVDHSLVADGQDATLLTVSVLDSAGNTVHLAGEQPDVTFAVEGAGKLIGLGSGDPADHTSDKADHRRAFNGFVRAVLQSVQQAGTIKVTASAPGLASSTLTITTTPPVHDAMKV